MAYAAYCETQRHLATPPNAQGPWLKNAAPLSLLWPHSRALSGPSRIASYVVMSVTVICKDAVLVRHAIAGCAGCGVLRCVPRLRHAQEPRARLEVRLPLSARDDVMRAVLTVATVGEFGPMVPWEQHVALYRLDHVLTKPTV